MSSVDRARDAIDLVEATVDSAPRLLEHAIFGKDLVYGRAPPRRVLSARVRLSGPCQLCRQG